MTKVILLKTISQAYYSSASAYTAFRVGGFGNNWDSTVTAEKGSVDPLSWQGVGVLSRFML